jgi:hypothetical protein
MLSQFTVIDAGYTATDYALNLLFAKPDCKFISVSNADNAYGSHIVDNVLHGERARVLVHPSFGVFFFRFPPHVAE